MDGQLLERARSIANGLLWPNVAATDAAEAVPAGQLDALADAGLYGLGAPAALGGLEAELGTVCAAIELLAGADLTTTLAAVAVAHRRSARAAGWPANSCRTWSPQRSRSSCVSRGHSYRRGTSTAAGRHARVALRVLDKRRRSTP